MLYPLILDGHAAVLAQASVLESLAERCGQAAAMNWLSHFLAASSSIKKKPYLVLIVRGEQKTSSLRLDDVHAAVLLFEYRALGLPTRTFSTDDWAGFRTVIAPEQERGTIAAMAADAMLKYGARMVLISYGHRAHSTCRMPPALQQPAKWLRQTRKVSMALPLEPTLQATLARLGKSTRFNLGYYRRRLAATVPVEFVSDACGILQEQELKTLNAGSLNPIGMREFLQQHESSCNLPGGFLLGLRNGRGEWLSLIGGWRQADVTVLYWQMNTAGYEKLSIGTAMRSHFLEHEVGLGTKKIVYYGGTPHSIGNSFLQEEVTDLIVQDRSRRSAVLQAIVRIAASTRFFPRVNSLLAQTIGGADFNWQSADVTFLESSGSELRMDQQYAARSPRRP